MLVMFALTVTASLAGEHLVKGLIAGAAGLFIRTLAKMTLLGLAVLIFGSDYLVDRF